MVDVAAALTNAAHVTQNNLIGGVRFFFLALDTNDVSGSLIHYTCSMGVDKEINIKIRITLRGTNIFSVDQVVIAALAMARTN